MSSAAPTYMLDTNVFDSVLDGRTPASSFAGSRLLVTGVQLAELRACTKPGRAPALLAVVSNLKAVPVLAASLLFGIEGAGWDQAEWNDGSGLFEKMLEQLKALDHKKTEARTNYVTYQLPSWQ